MSLTRVISQIRRPYLLAALLSAALVGAIPAFAQSSTNSSNSSNSSLSASEIASAQQQGASVARGLQGAPVLDSNGNVQRNSDGSVQTAPTSNASLNSEGVLMQQVTGTGGFKAAGNPGDGHQTFGGSMVQTTYVDIACTAPPGSLHSAGGVQFVFEGCQLSGTTVNAVRAQVCSSSDHGGDCTAADFSQTQALPASQYTTEGTLKIGVGCNNATDVCRLTVTNSYALSTQASQLKAKAQSSQNTSSDSTQQSLQTLVSSKNYQDAKAEVQPTVNCYDQNQKSFEQSGQVSTCDGKQTVAVSGGPAGGSCTPTAVCTQPTTYTTNWTRTCTRSFPITTLSCTLTTPTLDCTVTQDSTGATTSSCPQSQLQGAVLVGTQDKQCLQPGSSTGSGTASCSKSQWTAVYVFPDKSTKSNCAATPMPLAGSQAASCDQSLTDAQVLCSQNGWVGRTLSDQECQLATTDASGATVFTQLDYKQKAGCGYCATANVGYSCQGAPAVGQSEDTCSTSQLAGCTLSSVTPESTAYGLTTSQLETYSCSQTSQGCASWKTTNSCVNGDASYGTSTMTETTPGNNNSFNQVIADEGVVEAVSKSGNANAANPTKTPLIFSGQDLRCRKPLGFVGGVINNDCCQTSLTRTGGGHPGNACTQNEVKLAAARRANFAVYIGTYCSKKTNYLFFSRCDEQTQTYCVFDGLLPKLVQVQGRQQLQQMASSSAGATLQTAPLTYPFYSGKGGWTAPITVNGITIAAYQQPSYCESAEATAAEFAANPSADACPVTLQTWIAACEQSNGCGALPSAPEAGDGAWTITSIDPLNLISAALTPHAIAKGACDTKTGECAYEISAWPAGGGGRAMVSRDISFPVYAATNYSATPSQTQIGDTVFEGIPALVSGDTSTIGTLPATVSGKVSTDGGTSWTPVTLPTQITGNFTLPGTDITVTGGCLAATGVCDYRLIGSIAISAKPWGSATQPDCSGFTLDQFTALDMGKMDLSEWVASVTAQMKQSTGDLASQAQQEAANGPTNPLVQPVQPDSAVISPTEGLGPFAVTLTVTGNWPEMYSDPALNKDPVSSVSVNWGDCTGTDMAMPLPSGGFAVQHLYEAPDTAGICDINGPVDTSTPHNLTHQVVVTLYSLSGTHQVTLNVKNDWTDYSTGS